ncbi:MAG: hypothetical protein V1806_17445 [Pseudomonadota bacterium]
MNLLLIGQVLDRRQDGAEPMRAVPPIIPALATAKAEGSLHDPPGQLPEAFPLPRS